MRINTSSASQSRGLKRWFVANSNVLGSSVGTDKHIETSEREESQNILGESCYHSIKCTVTNSLAALMWGVIPEQ